MKKIFAILTVAVIMLSAFTSCGIGGGADVSGGEDTKANSNTEKSENPVNLNGDTIYLTYERNFKDMIYKEDIVDFHSNTVFNMSDISYSHDGETTYQIRMIYFEGKSIEEAMEGTESEPTDKTANGITYKYYESDAVFSDKTLPCHTYVYNFEDTTYCISFISEYDMTSLETVFMNNVRFEKSE